jgi:hypothetical protein
MAYLPDQAPKGYKTSNKTIGGLKVKSLTNGYQHAIDPGVADQSGGSGKSLPVNETKANLTSRTKVGFKK